MELHFGWSRRRLCQAAAWPPRLSPLTPPPQPFLLAAPAVLPLSPQAALSFQQGQKSSRERGAGLSLPFSFPVIKLSGPALQSGEYYLSTPLLISLWHHLTLSNIH